MQEKLTIARPYASAAFSYAEENGQIDEWSTMLSALAAAVSDPDLARLIGHPKITGDQLVALVSEILGNRLNDEGRNFIRVLVEAERVVLAPQIVELYERRRADAAGVVNVDVTSAFPLSEKERAHISEAMSARIGKTCEIETSLDPQLIGGAVIKIGDAVIDLSLRRRLSELAQDLI
ncbi:MAG: F0F1 ATP synthase subunit delta [Gammaproteobacteria bacterium]|nr:F0F1 ATP synthase subunit delta [Gammaproteobacteria bacterium]